MRAAVAVTAVLNLLVMSLIVTACVAIFYYRQHLNKCKERESDYCYTIHCPVDDTKSGPCFGFAVKKDTSNKDGKVSYFCSNMPDVAVDVNGKLIHK